MKMNYAGLSTSPNSKPENFRYNCTRNKSCQKEFFIPVNGLCDFMLYFELPFIPETYTIDIVDTCSGIANPATVINYLFGKHTGGFYGVIGGLIAANVPSQFYLKAVIFHPNGDEAVYYSHDFEMVTCEALTKVSSCYNDPSPGTPAFDTNDVYYGFPIGIDFRGNPELRYYHFLNVRKASVIGNKTKLSLNAFNQTKVYKAQATQQYNFFSESVPEFYKEEIVAVIARGNILIDGKPYQVAEEVELSVNDEDSKLWAMNIILNKVLLSYFSCKATICNFEPCLSKVIPEPEKCCSPMVTAMGVEVVDGDPTDPGYPCNKYEVSGNDETSSYFAVDCVTGVNSEFQIGRNVVLVCARERPIGQGVTITDRGSCTTLG